MFYIWHTLLVSAFIMIAFTLGFKLGKAKAKANTKKSIIVHKSKHSD